MPRSFCSYSDFRLGDVMVNSLRLIENNLTQWLIGFNNYTGALSALKSIDLKKTLSSLEKDLSSLHSMFMRRAIPIGPV